MNNDLISREALKEEHSKECIHNCYYCKHFKWSKKMACSYCDVIDNVPTVDLDERDNDAFETGYIKGLCENRPQGKWIPVSERLPEEGNTSYLVTVDYGGDIFSCQRFFFNDEIGWNDYSVIAWMPLPEPYKEGGAE